MLMLHLCISRDMLHIRYTRIQTTLACISAFSYSYHDRSTDTMARRHRFCTLYKCWLVAFFCYFLVLRILLMLSMLYLYVSDHNVKRQKYVVWSGRERDQPAAFIITLFVVLPMWYLYEYIVIIKKNAGKNYHIRSLMYFYFIVETFKWNNSTSHCSTF